MATVISIKWFHNARFSDLEPNFVFSKMDKGGGKSSVSVALKQSRLWVAFPFKEMRTAGVARAGSSLPLAVYSRDPA